MIGLTEGRAVHYVDEQGSHVAATIVRVSDPTNRLVSLFVFPRRPGETGGVIEDVPFSRSTAEQPTSRPLSWHWIERVGGGEPA